jgi:subtilisin family serine protease
MALKFLGADGSGSLQGAILAIDYATKNGAKIMSNSWGGGGSSELLKQAIERSHEAGVLFVAAAGNDGSNNDTRPTYPANYQVPNVLTVAAIDNKGAMASFSNYGKTTVHVGAPGVNIYSSITGGRYDSWSGTSMATPHVTGVAGLLLAHEPELTNVQLKERLIATATPLASLKGKAVGNGMVNAYNALTNTMAPPDMNDPARWASVDYAFSTPHPYGRKTEIVHEIEVPNANEMAIYFSKLDTERGYDKITLFNRDGAKVGEISGQADESFSEVIAGNYVKLVFKSDESVEKYGFDITKIAYR